MMMGDGADSSQSRGIAHISYSIPYYTYPSCFCVTDGTDNSHLLHKGTRDMRLSPDDKHKYLCNSLSACPSRSDPLRDHLGDQGRNGGMFFGQNVVKLPRIYIS